MDSDLRKAFSQRHGGHPLSDPNSRGKLFKPFAALKGYYDLIDLSNTPVSKKRALSDEELRQLNEAIATVEKGDIIQATFYQEGRCITRVVKVRQVDCALRTLHLTTQDIPFDDLLQISPASLKEQRA